MDIINVHIQAGNYPIKVEGSEIEAIYQRTTPLTIHGAPYLDPRDESQHVIIGSGRRDSILTVPREALIKKDEGYSLPSTTPIRATTSKHNPEPHRILTGLIARLQSERRILLTLI